MSELSVFLRDVGDADDDCWVVCNRVDPGAVEFVPLEDAKEAVEDAFEHEAMANEKALQLLAERDRYKVALERAEAEREALLRHLGSAENLDVSDVELEEALTGEGIAVYGPDAERFERMFAAVMRVRTALSQDTGRG